MTYFQAAIFLGLSAGPSLGGFMNKVGGFRAACYAAAAICALNLLAMIIFLPDS
eukprot:CAMPEP_0198496304 /NCGR_PEP_ID=MMETSP1462-20131121/5750_1 /TAXON_ID=1333877 /ORGANISM="Brandtodinium nutriculum, Strain RCC3387" /LENGTH=53 /DNA_ID=CAMNT_0044225131 /DNA_START=1 /DNA_END=158 /DNA_ORIENTATION=+